jgi:hypothetical protein
VLLQAFSYATLLDARNYSPKLFSQLLFLRVNRHLWNEAGEFIGVPLHCLRKKGMLHESFSEASKFIDERFVSKMIGEFNTELSGATAPEVSKSVTTSALSPDDVGSCRSCASDSDDEDLGDDVDLLD